MIMKNLLLLIAIGIISSLNLYGQDVQLVDFETGVTVTPSFGASFEAISNPDQTGLNETSTCGQIGRTGTNWWELVDVPVDFSIPANETRYVKILVKYDEQPDISVRLNSEDSGPRATNSYTDLGYWQDLVFEFSGGPDGKTVSQLRILGDVGFENDPAGQVLNNTDKFGLVDEIIVSENSTPRSTATSLHKEIEAKDYVVFSNNGRIAFRAEDDQVKQVMIYNSTGVLINSFKKNRFEFSVTGPGLYFVRVGNITEKIIVQ